MEFFKLSISGAIGAGIAAILQTHQSQTQEVKVTLEIPKQVFQFVHDTIRIEVNNGLKVTPKKNIMIKAEEKKSCFFYSD